RILRAHHALDGKTFGQAEAASGGAVGRTDAVVPRRGAAKLAQALSHRPVVIVETGPVPAFVHARGGFPARPGRLRNERAAGIADGYAGNHAAGRVFGALGLDGDHITARHQVANDVVGIQHSPVVAAADVPAVDIQLIALVSGDGHLTVARMA